MFAVDNNINNDTITISEKSTNIDVNDSKSNTLISYEEALRKIGFGKFQIIILIVSGLMLLTVLNETMGIAFIIPAAQCDLNLTASRKGLISTVSFIGILISSQIWGYLADTTGRRNVILYTLFLSNIFTVISSFINNFWLFAVTRFFSGFFIGGSSATVYAYLGEFNTVKNRATVIAWASVSVALSAIFIPTTAWLFLPQGWSIIITEDLIYRPWRLLLIIYAIPGFISALCMIKLPESPKYLLAQGNVNDAITIIKYIHKINNSLKKKKTNNQEDEFHNITLLPEVDEIHRERMKMKSGPLNIFKLLVKQTIPLFRPPHIFNFSNCCFLLFGVFFISGGMGLWFPDIQNKIALNNANVDQTICQLLDQILLETELYNLNGTATKMMTMKCNDTVDTKAFIDGLTMGIFYLIAFIIYSLAIKPLGRHIILATCLFGSACAGLLLQWITHTMAIVVLFSLHIMLAGICVSIVTGAVVDLIPTQLRGMAVCVALMFGRLGSIVGSNIIGLLLEINCTVTFYLYSFFILGCAILGLFLKRN